MSKRKQIESLEKALVQREEDTQHTHDALWQILTVLCDEFDLKLTIQPREEDNDEQQT